MKVFSLALAGMFAMAVMVRREWSLAAPPQNQEYQQNPQDAAGGPNLRGRVRNRFLRWPTRRARKPVWRPRSGTRRWPRRRLQHCRMMAAARADLASYGGEPDLSARAAQAGAHFGLIEENVAVGALGRTRFTRRGCSRRATAQNLLSPGVDHVGIAVVYARGVLYAVADYSAAVEQPERGAGGSARGRADSRERRGDSGRSQQWRERPASAMTICRVPAALQPRLDRCAGRTPISRSCRRRW